MRIWCLILICLGWSAAGEARTRNPYVVTRVGTLQSLSAGRATFISEGARFVTELLPYVRVQIGPTLGSFEDLKPGVDYVFHSNDNEFVNVHRIADPDTDWAAVRFEIEPCRIVSASKQKVTIRDPDALGSELDETTAASTEFKIWKDGRLLPLPFRQQKADATRFYRLRIFWGRAVAITDRASWKQCVAELRKRVGPERRK